MDWLRKLQAEANQPPAVVRVPFLFQDMEIGSVGPVFMSKLAVLVSKYWREQLLKEERDSCHLLGEAGRVTANLNQ